MTRVIIHFICRGNAFRSIIAEAYLNSLELNDLRIMSSGTAAAAHKSRNLRSYTETLGLLAKHGIRKFAKPEYGDQLTQARLAGADVAICMNRRVYEECQWLVTLPASTRIWSVADIGEPGRDARTQSEKCLRREEAYQEIVEDVDRLASGIAYGRGQ